MFQIPLSWAIVGEAPSLSLESFLRKFINMSVEGQDVNYVDSNGVSAVLLNGFAVTVTMLVSYFLYVRFLLEGIVMPKFFKNVYLDLDVKNRRSFVSHFLWLTIKIILIPFAWPFVLTFFCGKTLRQSIVAGSPVSNADMLSVAYLIVMTMFIFEIVYRVTISPVSLIHHIAACALGCWQIIEQIGDDDISTDSQFKLVILYGMFEVLFETFPHFAVLYYRCQPKTSLGFHKTSRIWFMSGISSLVGTTAEFIVMAIFMWKNWWKWGLGMKIVLPILHFCFMGAQVHGARIGFQLWRSFGKKSSEAKEVETIEQQLIVDPEKRIRQGQPLPAEAATGRVEEIKRNLSNEESLPDYEGT